MRSRQCRHRHHRTEWRGESTVLEIVAGFKVADRGEVLLNGSPAVSFAEKKAILSYMPERLFIYPDNYVHDFLSFIHQISGYSDPMLLQALGISGVKNKRVRHLSKDYHKRLKLSYVFFRKIELTQ